MFCSRSDSTIRVSMTVRDIHELEKLTFLVDEARIEKLLSEHHPLNLEKVTYESSLGIEIMLVSSDSTAD